MHWQHYLPFFYPRGSDLIQKMEKKVGKIHINALIPKERYIRATLSLK